MLSQLDNFIGWQNINLDTTLDNFDLYNLDKFVLAENSELSMNGMYELNFNPVEDFLNEQSYLSNYKISLLTLGFFSITSYIYYKIYKHS